MKDKTVFDITEKYGGYWGEHPDFPVADWQYEVSNGDTRSGYWEWVEKKVEDA